MREEDFVEVYDRDDGFELFLRAHGMVAKLYRRYLGDRNDRTIDFDNEPKEEKWGYYYVISKEDKQWRMSNGGKYGLVWAPHSSCFFMTKQDAERNLQDAIFAMMSMALNRDRINTIWDCNKAEDEYDDNINDGKSWYDHPEFLEEDAKKYA